ncbi:hypothetical protein GCM10017083_49750 [Thalassobaculum fulvum]|jgi:ribonuclease T2|uniref:Uncharacterized protein n=1 Tax=Thalassobaculum fulvum TaxID=1633335 RepID=A0A918XWL1_9PROT|nr:ribonuclease T2 [Thalassobaculum fulvum]GHD61837.1 hypothetical protein GCM10017083_49750 [Thalassobaculum fulvum]
MRMRTRWLPVWLVVAAALSSPAGAADALVLAVSWQPAFCETRPEKPECTSQTADRYDASHLSLHGLWPEPRDNVYCGVGAAVRATDEAGRWQDLPAIGLTEATRTGLERAMPGSRSFLHRHEWIKHGTCYGTSPETYFADSLRLLAELNASAVRALLADGIGRVVTGRAVRKRFDAAFGAGAGNRVELICRRVGARRLLVEMRIGLAGPVTENRSLAELLAGAPDRPPGCGSGIVDRAGIGLDGDPS